MARIWDVASARNIASEPYQATMTAAAFSPDARFAALILDGTELVIVGLPDARRVFSIRGQKFVSLAIGTSGVVAAVDAIEFGHPRVRLWRSSDWSELPGITFESRQDDVALSANGEFIGLTGDDEMARVVRTGSGLEVARFAGQRIRGAGLQCRQRARRDRGRGTGGARVRSGAESRAAAARAQRGHPAHGLHLGRPVSRVGRDHLYASVFGHQR